MLQVKKAQNTTKYAETFSAQRCRRRRGLKPLPGGNTWTKSEGTRDLASGTTRGSTPTSRMGVESSRECSEGWRLGEGGGGRIIRSEGMAVNISCKPRWAWQQSVVGV